MENIEQAITEDNDCCTDDDSTDNDTLSMIPIPGVDMKKGMVMTGGTEDFYRKVLAFFNKDALERLPRLQTAPEPDALRSFVTQVHSLKSASAAIGAAELSVQAAALEAAGKTGDFVFIKDNLRGFTGQLTELVENIRAALETDSRLPASDSQLPAPDSRLPIPESQLLNEFAEALKSQNFVEIDRIMEELNQKQLDSRTREILEKISDDVLMTEFGNALKSVEELLNTNK